MKKDEVFELLLEKAKHIKSLRELMLLVRHNIQFNNCPSYEDMKKGEMDCVGVSFLLKRLIQKLFKGVNVKVVALPSLPWLRHETSLSKHTGVVVFFINGFIIIDATPINGYGYGKITELLSYDMWQSTNNEWFLKKVDFSLDSEAMWDKVIYNHFKVLNTMDVKTIFYINDLRSHNLKTIIDIKATNHEAWNKEYWRVRGKLALQNKNKANALKFFERAFQIDNRDPYLLVEFANILKGKKKKQIIELHAKVVKELHDDHKKIVDLWKEKCKLLYKQKNWSEYLRYLGMIYWRERSLSHYAGIFPEQIDFVSFRNKQLPLYKLTPAWFKNNNVGVLIVNDKDMPSFQGVRKGKVNEAHIDIYDKVFGIKNISGNITLYLIDKDNDLSDIDDERFTLDPVQSHYWYLGILNPELIII